MSRIPLRVSTLVNTKWLADKLTSRAGNFRLLDASWHFPFTKRNARQEFYKNHIFGAQFFDIDDCCDKNSAYDHMLPTPSQFEDYVGKLGISNSTHVVVYDNNETFGMLSAQRVWWTFKVFGHNLVSVLDGGLPKWTRDGYDTTDEVEFIPSDLMGKFKANFNPDMVRSFEQLEKNLKEPQFTVLDARPAGRFAGTAPEPRPGTKSGHMPNAVNIPFASMIDSNTKTLKTPEKMKEVFDEAGVDLNQPIVASCGSGVSACILVLAAELCGRPSPLPVYDGSWAEWYKRAHPKHKVNVPL